MENIDKIYDLLNKRPISNRKLFRSSFKNERIKK